ncbi:MAG TPA: hypothetical protein VFU88_20715 [Ktedonobacterales bacterium]|nr:hypothetical protein [Ktedonobacterales bacterium]
MVSMLVLASCALPLLPDLSVLHQRDGRPTLHRLNWGYAYVDSGVWSPDGRWVAAFAGPDYLADNPVVVSPDGRVRHSLTNWHCGLNGDFDFVWSPDGQLGCIVASDFGRRLCRGRAPAFRTCQEVRLPQELGRTGMGSTFSSDGQTLWIAAIHDLSPNESTRDPNLFVVMAATGALVQMFVFSADEWNLPDIVDGGVYLPQWVPQHQALSYEIGVADSEGPGQLVMSPVTPEADGHFVLGPRTVLASGQAEQGYAWSPSGRWVAVRIGIDYGNDHIALVNADDPSQTVDVTNEQDVGQFLGPTWSPDGSTLLVFGAGDERPYAIDIGSYLASKGLQP